MHAIQRVQNPEVFERYALRRKIVAAETPIGDANVRELWHGTPSANTLLCSSKGVARRQASSFLAVRERFVVCARRAPLRKVEGRRPRE